MGLLHVFLYIDCFYKIDRVEDSDNLVYGIRDTVYGVRFTEGPRLPNSGVLLRRFVRRVDYFGVRFTYCYQDLVRRLEPVRRVVFGDPFAVGGKQLQ